ncbi:Galactokinase [Halomonadaceae bacterium LMG 33818]|uniref:mevalonate kinase n=1 Tax=Cernens ardua TaxID=3402176 RepID=UPI003EDC59A8
MQREQRTLSQRVGYGTTSGKVILIGEHSVVYGEPAIAIPLLGITMHARVTRGSGPAWFKSRIYDGPMSELPQPLSGIRAALDASLEQLNSDTQGLVIHIDSEVPAERGMGSSAAVAGAVVKAIHDLHDTPLTRQSLFDLVQISERIAHGKPSGLDAVTTTSQHAVHFHQGNFTDVEIRLSGYIVIADTGIKGGTRETVAAVRRRFEQQRDQVEPEIQYLGELTREAKRSIDNDDLITLGKTFNAAHETLSRLGVSSPELETLVNAARQHGALGAKLTGGGGGGCMLALCRDAQSADKVSDALYQAGAQRVWIHSFENHQAPEHLVKDTLS